MERLERLEHLEHLERLEHLEHLERLEHLEHLEHCCNVSLRDCLSVCAFLTLDGACEIKSPLSDVIHCVPSGPDIITSMPTGQMNRALITICPNVLESIENMDDFKLALSHLRVLYHSFTH